jgi:hypothetical protein
MHRTKVKPLKPSDWNFYPFSARAFTTKEEIRVLAVNRTPLKKEVSLTVDSKRWTGEGKLFSFSAPDLTTRLKIRSEGSNIRELSVQGGKVSIPPFSINVITLDRKKK